MGNFLRPGIKNFSKCSAKLFRRIIAPLVLHCMYSRIPVMAQGVPFVGIQDGISALSADSRAIVTPEGLSTSLYTPANGPVVGLFGGAHMSNYLSVQAGYSWNSNGLILSSSSSASNSFYVQQRRSSQQTLIVDFLVYFRRLDSRFRPYLAVGTGISHFSSAQRQLTASGGVPLLPPSRFSSTRPLLDVPVGLDVAVTSRIALRYSFSETIRHNDIGAQLSPTGQRSLANFRNLFGIVFRL